MIRWLIYHETKNCDEILTTTNTWSIDRRPPDRTGYNFSFRDVTQGSGSRTVWRHFKDDLAAVHDFGMGQVVSV